MVTGTKAHLQQNNFSLCHRLELEATLRLGVITMIRARTPNTPIMILLAALTIASWGREARLGGISVTVTVTSESPGVPWARAQASDLA